MNYYSEASELFDRWSDQGTSKQIINFITEYLVGDTFWLNENISKVDREQLVNLGKFLERK